MRIAYIVLAHRLPQQVARLIARLADRDSAFFVHLDKSADRRLGFDLQRTQSDLLPKQADVVLLKRHSCHWGSFQIVAATLEGIDAIMQSGKKFDRVVLLSGQDYPIKPVPEIKSFFANHPATEFIESFLLTAPNRWTEHQGPYNAEARVSRWHLHVRGRILTLPLRRRFLHGSLPYGGSQWWALTMDCIAHIWRTVQSERRFVSFFRYSFIPDEHFFHTIVSNSRFAERISGYDITYADWSRPAPPYPATLDRGYIDILSGTPKLFARKFDISRDPDVLDRVDEQLMNKDTHRNLGYAT